MTLSPRRRTAAALLMGAGLAVLATSPAFAQTTAASGGNIGSFIQNVISILNSNVIRGLAILAIIITGIAWMFGHVDLRRAGTVVVGIIVIFSAAGLVDLIVGGASGADMAALPETRLTEDPLFLACTRPAMVAGVPMEAMAANVIVSAVVFLAAHSLLYLLIAPALHLVFRAVCKHDPNAFRVLWQFVETKGRSRNGATWGGSSLTPLPVRRAYTALEVTRG